MCCEVQYIPFPLYNDEFHIFFPFFSLFPGKILPNLGGAVYSVGSPKTQFLALNRGGGCLTGGLFGMNYTGTLHMNVQNVIPLYFEENVQLRGATRTNNITLKKRCEQAGGSIFFFKG